MISEEDIYIGMKNCLKKCDWKVIAGQPPDGCDHLPVVEIKDKNKIRKGSGKAFKPDLIAYKNNFLLVVECKPKRSQADIDKLNLVSNDFGRRANLIDEIYQRRLLHDFPNVNKATLVQKILFGIANGSFNQNEVGLICFRVISEYGDFELFPPSNFSLEAGLF